MPADPVAPPSGGVFTVGRRGYDPQQVDAHLRRVDAEVRILVADRDAAVDQAAQLGRELDEARQRADRLRAQVRTMAARPSDVQGMSERMRTMLRLAEDEVADMLRRADAEVARRLGEVDARAEELLGTARAEAATVLDSARTEAATVRETARAQAEQSTRAAQRRQAELEAAAADDRAAAARERAAAASAADDARAAAERTQAHAWAESEARRAEVEEDFRLAMDQRRAEALAGLQAERARMVEATRRSQDETTRQCRVELAAAEETARRIVADARARSDEMAQLRDRIGVQLRAAQRELFETLAALTPGSEPPALPGPRSPAAAAIEAGPAAVEAAPSAGTGAVPPAGDADDVTRPLPIVTADPATPVADTTTSPEQNGEPPSRPRRSAGSTRR